MKIVVKNGQVGYQDGDSWTPHKLGQGMPHDLQVELDNKWNGTKDIKDSKKLPEGFNLDLQLKTK